MALHRKNPAGGIRYRLLGARRVRGITLMVDLDEAGMSTSIVGVWSPNSKRYTFVHMPSHAVEGTTLERMQQAILQAAIDASEDGEVARAVR